MRAPHNLLTIMSSDRWAAWRDRQVYMYMSTASAVCLSDTSLWLCATLNQYDNQYWHTAPRARTHEARLAPLSRVAGGRAFSIPTPTMRGVPGASQLHVNIHLRWLAYALKHGRQHVMGCRLLE